MKPEQQKNLLFILVPSTIVVIAWIGFGIYNKAVSTTLTTSQTASIQPITGTFDMRVFDLLKKRQVVLPVSQADEIPVTPLEGEASPSAQQLTDLPPGEESLPPLGQGEAAPTE